MQFYDYLARNLRVKVLMKRPREKHILEVEESSVRLHFASTSQERLSCEVPTKPSAWRILSVTFLLLPILYIPSLLTKVKETIQRKILERFLQRTHLF